jgi:hypothetical protein
MVSVSTFAGAGNNFINKKGVHLGSVKGQKLVAGPGLIQAEEKGRATRYLKA